MDLCEVCQKSIDHERRPAVSDTSKAPRACPPTLAEFQLHSPQVTEARTGRLRPRAGVGASASRRLRGRSLRGEGARAAVAAVGPGGPGRLTFIAYSSKSGVTQYWQGVPGAFRARIRPGSVRIALLLINTVFRSGTSFVRVSAGGPAGRRLWLRESMKN